MKKYWLSLLKWGGDGFGVHGDKHMQIFVQSAEMNGEYSYMLNMINA